MRSVTESDEETEKDDQTQYGGTEDHNLSGAEGEEKATEDESNDDEDESNDE